MYLCQTKNIDLTNEMVPPQIADICMDWRFLLEFVVRLCHHKLWLLLGLNLTNTTRWVWKKC